MTLGIDQNLEPEIIYEAEDFMAIHKPAGLMVHRARVAPHRRVHPHERTVVDWLLEIYPGASSVGDDPELRPGIVHRLDKETSGVMLLAKTPAGFEYLKSAFQKHEIKKIYYAMVDGVPGNRHGIIDAPIGIENGTLARSTRSTKMQKEAITEYDIKKSGGGFSLLEVRPRTGRTHQIRVHLASIGHPIVGDRLYGSRRQPAWATRMMLHAYAMIFLDMTGTRLRIEADIPEVFRLPSYPQ